MVSRSRANLEELQQKLVPYLQSKMPDAKGITVLNMKAPESGFASETFMFTLQYEEGGKHHSKEMVFRRPPLLAVFPDYDLRRQFLVMQRLQGTGVPVPRVFWRVEQDEGILGTPFYIMERLPGMTPPDFPLYHSAGIYHDASPQKRAKMWWGSLEGIVKVHQVDWRKQRLHFLGAPKGGTSTIDGLLDYFDSMLKWVAKGEPQPVLEYAIKWLRENHYVPERITLCWGDCRMPNTLYDADGNVVALLDWEFSYLGDPVSDLAWFLFLDWHSSEAYGIPKLEGTPSEEETIRRYEELTGWKVKNLLFNQVLAPLRLGVPLVRLYKNLRSMGVTMLADDAELNNPMTQRIAALLNLPAPGKKKDVTKIEDMKVILQMHFTGPGARDWYALFDHGQITVHDGKATDPVSTMTLAASDFEAIQRGELGQSDATLMGKIKIEGDITLAADLLERLVAKLGGKKP
ncbi:MAG: phosphotransferase [Dehalococcoidia bacterium]|nr:phosphotransferase [Dehalococcoidia bacterium]